MVAAPRVTGAVHKGLMKGITSFISESFIHIECSAQASVTLARHSSHLPVY